MRPHPILALLPTALLALGCNNEPNRAAQPDAPSQRGAQSQRDTDARGAAHNKAAGHTTTAGRTNTAGARKPIDPRDQYAFVRDVSAAQRADADEDPGAYHRVLTSWSGKRYRWELAYVPLLCRSPEACVMAPFDHARAKRRIVQGWLPKLQLDDTAHQALRAQCEDKKRCIATVEGTMQLTLSSQQATRVLFENAAVVSTRDAAQSESWIVARR